MQTIEPNGRPEPTVAEIAKTLMHELDAGPLEAQETARLIAKYHL